MVKRQRIDQWAETKSLRALRHGSQKYAGRGCHAEWRRVMLGNMIGIEAHLIISLDKLEACLVVILQWQIAAVQMVEYAKFHRSDQGPFAVVDKNLMRFAEESTELMKNVIICDSRLGIWQIASQILNDHEKTILILAHDHRTVLLTLVFGSFRAPQDWMSIADS